MNDYYQAEIHCWQCPYGEPQGVSRQFSVRCYTDKEGVNRWCFAKGQKPRGWFVDEEAELNFYDSEGNSTDIRHDSIGVIYGLCPRCNKMPSKEKA